MDQTLDKSWSRHFILALNYKLLLRHTRKALFSASKAHPWPGPLYAPPSYTAKNADPRFDYIAHLFRCPVLDPCLDKSGVLPGIVGTWIVERWNGGGAASSPMIGEWKAEFSGLERRAMRPARRGGTPRCVWAVVALASRGSISFSRCSSSRREDMRTCLYLAMACSSRMRYRLSCAKDGAWW
jgi:hypothetical protein